MQAYRGLALSLRCFLVIETRRLIKQSYLITRETRARWKTAVGATVMGCGGWWRGVATDYTCFTQSVRPAEPSSYLGDYNAGNCRWLPALCALSNNLRPDYKCLYYPSARQDTQPVVITTFIASIFTFTVSPLTMYSRYYLGLQKRCPIDVRFLIKVPEPDMHYELTTPAQ